MSETTTTHERTAGSPPEPDWPSQSGGTVRTTGTARKARIGIIAILVLGLLISAGSRQWAMGLQRHAHLTGPYAPAEGAGGSADGPAGSAGPTLGSLDSYFLILVLGGLRGPLAMFLWTSSENQKNERDLEDFDTKVELIRLLQPEFDSVHIFQMWNKAYNISAQVASLPNKYAVILDALEYGKNVDRSRPNNLNILLELNKIYQHKLGTTTNDSVYYRRQVREDSKWREVKNDGVGALDRRMPPVLDPKGNVLPELVRPRSQRPENLAARVVLPVAQIDALKAAAGSAGVTLPAEQITPPAGAKELALTIPEPSARKIDPLLQNNYRIQFIYADWNDGSDLQYLKRYEPYPYGVSPLALGYNYGKRAQVLMNRTGQRPAQSGPSVVDSRPGMELRQWAESEWDQGLASEATAFGRPVMNERHAMLLPTADLPPVAAPLDPAEIQRALYSLQLARQLFSDSRAEYTRHLFNTTEGIRRMQDYTAHLDAIEADELLVNADLNYLQAITTSDSDRKRSHLAQAAEGYRQAEARYRALDLRFYTPGEMQAVLFPPDVERRGVLPDWRNLLTMAGFPAGINRDNAKDYIDQPDPLIAFHTFVTWGLRYLTDYDQNQEARGESAHFIMRAQLRQMQIARALNPNARPRQILPIPVPGITVR